MYGLDRLAKQLSELVRSGRIQNWHPGRWVDRHHDAIGIGFVPPPTLCLPTRHHVIGIQHDPRYIGFLLQTGLQ
jgi:hypothetical protein